MYNTNTWMYRFKEAKVKMAMSEFRTIYEDKWPECLVINAADPQPKRVKINVYNVSKYDAWWAKGFCWNENNRRQILRQVSEYGKRHGLIYYASNVIEKALRVTYVSQDAPLSCDDEKYFRDKYLYIVFFPIIEVKGEQNTASTPRVPRYMDKSEGGRWNVSIKLQAPLYAPISGLAEIQGRRTNGEWFPDKTFSVDRPGWDEQNLREILDKVSTVVKKYDCDFVAMPSKTQTTLDSYRESFTVLAHDRRTGLNTYLDFSVKQVEKDELKGYFFKGYTYELGECLTKFPEDTIFPWCETKLNSHGFPIYHIGGGKYVSQEFINKWFPANDECRKEEAKCLYEAMDDGSARVTMMHRSWSQPTWQRFAVKEETYNEYQECSEFDLWETGRWDPHSDGESMDKCLENALRSLDKMGCAMIGELRLERIQNPWGTHTHVWKVDTIDKYTGKRYRTLECEIRTPKNCGSFGMKYHLPGFGLSYDLRRMGALTPEEQHQQRLQEAAENKEPVVEEESTTEISENACKWWFDAHYDDLEELEANIDEERCFRIPATMLVGVSRPAMFKALGNLAYKYDAINGQADGSILIHVAEPVSDDDIELLAEFEGNDQGLADYIASNVNCD